MGTYQKTKGIQSYLRMWGSYDPIESDPLEPKNWVLYGRSEKKCKFCWPKIIQNWLWWLPESPPCNAVNTNKLPFWSTVIVILIKFLQLPKIIEFWHKIFIFWTQKG